MAQPTDLERTLVDNLTQVDRIAAAMARRHNLSGDEAADFAGWVRLRLVEDDYAILRRFRGESAITTYLTVVVAMLARDYRVRQWGRWRPSAEARRRGRLAVRLEMLVYRRGCTLSEAGQILRTSGETGFSDRELAALLAELPRRLPLRPVAAGEAALDGLAAQGPADVLVVAEANEQERRRATTLVAQLLEAMPHEDRLVLHLRFWEGLSVADIARGLQLEQKPLYRRLERLLAHLQAQLVSAGMTATVLRDLLDESAA